MTRLEKLLMRVELLDKVTGPANKIMGTMNKLTADVVQGFGNIAGGAVGIWGVGAALTGLTNDYHDFSRAAGEVRSLSVADDAMKHLQKTALKFSIRYGESAADFVRSSYDIQSAIAGLVGTELATFTEASNILAKGTKADAATITNYMGTMYGIFKNQADAMGKADWVKQLTGQTAQAVEMFKTNGMQMSGAFTALGADATAHGIAINEQMAVLGKLQATMSGSEAGTKYKAFLRGVGAAQEKLGMQFTDSAGRMLPVDQILSKLQGKFGEIDTVAESDLLKKAFGSDEAVAAIKLLIADTNGLTDSINTLGNITGMDKARAMAEAMTKRTDQLNQAAIAVRIGFGALVDKALIPFYDSAINNLAVLSDWIDKYPHLFGALAKAAVWIGIVVAAVAAFAIIKGAAIIAVAGFTTALTILKAPLALVRGGIWLWNAALAASRILLLTTAIRFPLLITGLIAMKAGFIAGAASAWAFAAALLANPITWVVVGVVALVAALAYVVTHWDSVKAAALGAITFMVEKWHAFRAIIEDNPILKFIFQPLLLAADFVGFLITHLEKIPQWFTQFKNWLSELDVFGTLLAPVKWLLDKLKLIPGIKMDASNVELPNQPAAVAPKALAGAEIPKAAAPTVVAAAEIPKAAAPTVVALAQLPPAIARTDEATEKMQRERASLAPAPVAPVRNVPQGGLMQQINNSNTSNKGTSIGTLNVSTTQPVNGYTLRDQLLMSS
jgi:hypothetical protein